MQVTFKFPGGKMQSLKLKRHFKEKDKAQVEGFKKIGLYVASALKVTLKPSNPVKLRKSEHPELRSRTGELRRSINYQISTGGRGVIVGPNKEYARIHEYGGYTGVGHKTYIPKRAYFWPTIKKIWKHLIQRFHNEFFKPIRKG